MFAILSSFLSGKDHRIKLAAALERRAAGETCEATDCAAAYREGIRLRLDEDSESRFEGGARGF